MFQPLKLPDGQEQVLWPVHCVTGTWGAELHPELHREPDSDVIVHKGTVQNQEYYSAFNSACGKHHTHLAELLRAQRITDVVVCGLVYEYCVGNSAVDSARAGFRTHMLTDVTKGLTTEGMTDMEKQLRAAGVNLCESHELPLDEPSLPPSRVNSNATSALASPCSDALSFSAGSAPGQSAAPTRAPSTVAQQDSIDAAASTSQSVAAASSSAANSVASAASGSSIALAADSALSPRLSLLSVGGGAVSAPPRPRLLLGLSGSVATIKALELVSALSQWASVRVVATEAALHFVDVAALQHCAGADMRVYRDEDEWAGSGNGAGTGGKQLTPYKRGDAVLHIELRRWADLLLIAPLSANTLAKISNGLCDNLLTTIVRAWPLGGGGNNRASGGTTKQLQSLLLAPAMNTLMWESPFTSRQLRTMQDLSPGSVHVIPPVEKTLACGDTGTGAMAAVDAISARAKQVWAAQLAAGYQQQPPPSLLESGFVPVAAKGALGAASSS